MQLFSNTPKSFCVQWRWVKCLSAVFAGVLRSLVWFDSVMNLMAARWILPATRVSSGWGAVSVLMPPIFFPYISKGNYVQLRKEMIRRHTCLCEGLLGSLFFKQETILVPGLPTCHIFKEEEHSYYILCKLYYTCIKPKMVVAKNHGFLLSFSCTAEGSRDDPVWCCFRCRCRVPGQELSWIWTFWVIYPVLGSSPS